METGGLILAATRALHIGCALLLGSLPFFVTCVWRPAPGDSDAFGIFRRRVLAAIGALLVVEALSGMAWLWSVAASMADESMGRVSLLDIGLVLTQTHFGALWIARGILAVVLGVLAASGTGVRASDRISRIILWLALAVGALLLGSLAFAGHAASGLRWPVAHLIVDVVHLLAGAVWPMGLVPLAMFLALLRSCGGFVNETGAMVVRQYSRCAFAAVLVIVASGVANSGLTLPSWSALSRSTYGWLLITKVLIVLAMIALGAFNRYRFLPALAGGSTRSMARTVALETVLAVLVLAIVGMMGMTPPGP